MSVLSLTAYASKVRLDKYLADEIEILSRTKIKQCIKSAGVLVNGQPEKPSFLLQGGEVIQIEMPEGREASVEAEDIALDILYEDDQLIVVNKAAGLVVHPGAGNYRGTLVNGLVYHFDQLSHVYGSQRPGIVHRLDKDTSGVLVIAKTDEAHMNLAEQFSNRKVDKTYLALVWGSFEEEEGRIDSPIARHPRNRKKFKVGQTGRSALTVYRVLESFDYLSLVELVPKTGRTHQLRVHLSSIQHPVFADDTYGGGSGRIRGCPSERRGFLLSLYSGLRRQALHALALSLDHPASTERMTFTAPFPEDFQRALRHLRSEHA